MSETHQQVRPRKRAAVRSLLARVLIVTFFVLYLTPALSFLSDVAAQRILFLYWCLVLISIVRACVHVALSEKPPTPVSGRQLAFSDGLLRQYDGEQVVAEIDATRPFEYEIVDRYVLADAVFRLHQEGRLLAFRVSDLGGLATVRNVLQIKWPPRPHHVGRSYPPSAA